MNRNQRKIKYNRRRAHALRRDHRPYSSRPWRVLVNDMDVTNLVKKMRPA